VCIEIKTTEWALSKEAETLLFSPNFTTKSSGMGLGLAIVKKYCREQWR
jgi:C4-dicarboxylate-specific signal transduction histidine kinase